VSGDALPCPPPPACAVPLASRSPHPLTARPLRSGSRADEFHIRFHQVNQGKGLTSVTVEHDATLGAKASKVVYKKKGWRTSGHGKPLHLVAFRDDHDEVYEFSDVRVDYIKEY